MLPEEKLKTLIQNYLRYKVGEPLLKKALAKNLKPIEEALLYLESLCGDVLQLSVMADASLNKKSSYKKHQAYLFELLDNALTFKSIGEVIEAVAVDKQRASLKWFEIKALLDLPVVTDTSKKTSMTEQYLQGNLKPPVWLTELDLVRFVQVIELNDRVHVVKLSDDIGSILHLEREKHAGVTDEYEIGFIVNTGLCGTRDENGCNWVAVNLRVNPITKTIVIDYANNDSISKEVSQRIIQKLNEAINTHSITDVNHKITAYSAYPNYTVVINKNKTVDTKGGGWQYGYMAIKDLVHGFKLKHYDNDILSELKKLDNIESTHDFVCHKLLVAARFSDEEIAQFPNIHFTKDYAGGFCLAEKDINAWLYEYSTDDNLSEESSDANEAYILANNKNGLLQIDLDTLFVNSFSFDQKKKKLQSLVRTINRHTEIEEISFVNFENITSENQAMILEIFDGLTQILCFYPRVTDNDFSDKLLAIAARNHLLTYPYCSLKPKSNPWHTLWHARLKDPELYAEPGYHTKYLYLQHADVREYVIVDIAEKRNEFLYRRPVSQKRLEQVSFTNPAWISGSTVCFDAYTMHLAKVMGPKYLVELFSYLNTQNDISNFLLYDNLVVGTPLNEKDLQHKNGIEISLTRKLTIGYLDALIEVLSDERTRKNFPFKKLELRFSDFNDIAFDKLCKVLVLLGQCNKLNAVNLTIYVPSKDYLELSKLQRDAIKEIFKQNHLKFYFHVVNQESDHELDEIVYQTRKLNDAKATHSMVLSAPLSKQEKYMNQMRKAKLPAEDISKLVGIEITHEHQQEQDVQLQNQHQHQHTFEVALEHKLEVKAQQQNEYINLSAPDEEINSAIDFTRYHVMDSGYDSNLYGNTLNLTLSDKQIRNLFSRDRRLGFWKAAISGHTLRHSITLVSPVALAKIHAQPKNFMDGFNIDNLPVGFYVLPHKSGLYLGYDNTVVEQNNNPLTLRETHNRQVPIWRGGLEDVLPNADKATRDGLYIPTVGFMENEKFYQFIMAYDPDLANVLQAKHGWYFKYDDKRLLVENFRLADILYFYKDKTVLLTFLDKLKAMRKSHPSLFDSLYNNLDLCAHYRDLASPEGLAVLDKIANLNEEQKDWWMTLTHHHYQYNDDTPLIALFQAFEYFLKQLPLGLKLPTPCPLNARNMFVSLDRCLFILSKVSGNLQGQMKHLNGLSFGQEDAWYAAKWDGYHYFHAEMHLYPEGLSYWYEGMLGRGGVYDYRVDFEILKKFCQLSPHAYMKGDASPSITKNYAYILFHRYLGGANVINPDYDYYVNLTNALKRERLTTDLVSKILCLVAVATTGQRGTNSLAYEGLFELIFNQTKDAQDCWILMNVLDGLVNTIDNWKTKPNLDELQTLLAFLLRASNPDKVLAELNIAKLNPKQFVDVILALAINKSLSGLPDFFAKSVSHYSIDEPENYGLLAKIFALGIRNESSTEEVKDLSAALLMLKSKNKAEYESLLLILSSISVEESDKVAIPQLSEMVRLVEHIIKHPPRDSIVTTVKALLPGCKFNLQSKYSDGKRINIPELISKNIQVIDEQLTLLGLTRFDINAFYSHPAEYIQSLWNKFPDLLKIVFYGKVTEVISSFLSADMETYVSVNNEYKLLQTHFKPQGGFFANGQSQIGKDCLELKVFSDEFCDLIASIEVLRQKFGANFNVDFLYSANVKLVGMARVTKLLHQVNALPLKENPEKLFILLLPQKALKDRDAANQYLDDIACLLETNIDAATLELQLQLLMLLNDENDSELLTNISAWMLNIKKQNPALFSIALQVLMKHVPDTSPKKEGLLKTKEFIDQLIMLFADINNPLLAKIIALLETDSEGLSRLLTIMSDIKLKEHKLNFLKIVITSLVKDNDDKPLTHLFASSDKNIPVALARMINNQTHDFMALLKLYDGLISPQSRFIKHYLEVPDKIASEERRELIDQFNLNPYNYRMVDADRSAQFNNHGLDAKINEIVSLTRGGQLLFLSERKHLMEQMLYINAVGATHPLIIPGAQDVSYHKPVKELSIETLADLLKHYRAVISGSILGLTQEDIVLARLEAIAVIREVMFRTTGVFLYPVQILSILNACIHKESHVPEIDTGQGKTATTALLAIVKWLEVKDSVVNIVTDNLDLASRDAEFLLPFYDAIGLKVNMLTQKSSIENYRQADIHYTDMNQCAQFIEKMEIDLEELPPIATTIFDEVDAIVFDNNTQFKYAIALDQNFIEHVNPNAWIYPLILEFIKTDTFKNPNATRFHDIENLRAFVMGHPNRTDYQTINTIDIITLDKWLDSACIAAQLENGEHFTIRKSQIIIKGVNTSVQEAKVKIAGRISEGANFSNGVHQFLHARLNLEMQAKQEKGDPFNIEPEKTFIVSKSAKNIVDKFRAASQSIYGLTATAGAEQEIAELNNTYRIRVTKIPRNRPSNRKDLKPVLAKRSWFRREDAKTAHFRHILMQVRRGLKQGRPILIPVKSVAVSKALYEYLWAHLNKKERELLQLYNGEFNNGILLKQAEAESKAGYSGTTTISNLMARGINISPRDIAEMKLKYGLLTIDTYISGHRDYGQKIGRSGRGEDEGESILVVSEEEFTENNLPIPSSAGLDEAIEKIRNIKNAANYSERTIKQGFADILDEYFSYYIQVSQHIKTTVKALGIAHKKNFHTVWKEIENNNHRIWENFLRKTDEEWQKMIAPLSGKILTKENEEALQDKLKVIQQFAEELWLETKSDLESYSHPLITESYEKKSPKFKARVYPASEPYIPQEIGYNALSEEDLLMNRAYANLTQHINDAALDVETHEKIVAIKEEAYKEIIEKIYKKLFSQLASIDTAKMLEACIKRLLVDDYKVYTNTFIGTYSVSGLLTELLVAQRDYSQAPDCNTTMSCFKAHLSAHQDNDCYVQRLMQSMHEMQAHNFIKADKPGSLSTIALTDNGAVLELLDTYIKTELAQYRKCFKSKDRGILLKDLNDEINDIVKSSNSTNHKILKLIKLMQEFYKKAKKIDSDKDFSRGKWSLFATRNVSGSRFCQMLTRIENRLKTYLPNTGSLLPNRDMNDSDIAAASGDLDALLLKMEHAKLRDRDEIIAIANDKELSGWIKDLSIYVDETSARHELLALISERLTKYKPLVRHLANRAVVNSNSIRAFETYYEEVQGRLQQFKVSQDLSDKINKVPSNDAFFSNPESELRKRMVASLKGIFNEKEIIRKGIDLSKYESMIPKEILRHQKALIASTLFEAERHLKGLYKECTTNNFEVTYKDRQLTIVIHWRDKQTPKKTTIVIDHFSQQTKEALVCYWPKTVLSTKAEVPAVVPPIH